jgi:carboxyl-terminal processing protease
VCDTVVVVARGLGDGVAYVKLRQFQELTPHDLNRALGPFARAGMKALILDLRNNSGGLLTAAIEVAEMFLESGKLVSYTEGRSRNQNMRFSAHAKKPYTGIPMVALVNQGSAAGAEIVAGALQDWTRASLLGTQTFGRASIQTIIPLSDGSGLRLTTARWFTPKGRLVHGKGLAPDRAVEGRDVPPVTSGTTEEELLARDVQLRSALEHLTRLIAPKAER